MSQQKVDRYKKEKYSRKKQLQKEKRDLIIYKIAGTVIGAAIVVWIGFSVYARVQENTPVTYTEVNMDAVNNYMAALD